MAIVALYHLGGGVWGFGIRRPLEAGMMTIPLMVLLFVPLLFGLPNLYPWARPEEVAVDPILQHREPYLNLTFVLIRVVLYFLAWTGGALLLYRTSLEQDRTGDPDLPRLLGRRGRLALFFFVAAVTFSAIDWAMALDPHWFSTIYGIMFLIGDGLTGIAFAIIVLRLLSQRSPTAEVTTTQTFNDLGNLLLAFVTLWAYMNLSQFLIIWSANLPEENPWYLRRTEGGWWWITLGLVAFQFVLPFLILLARGNKRNPILLSRVAMFVLVMRLVDLFWMIMPEVRREGLYVHWLDIVAPVGIGGIWVAVFIWMLKRQPILPLHDHRDPRLRPADGHGEHASHPAGQARA
ncbi:MAG TPA: hypothetical protein VFU22_00025, partial [Roseiflexaceae bacterium]|nr:hypothetical protein [Roseiflexaceae bacterium]